MSTSPVVTCVPCAACDCPLDSYDTLSTVVNYTAGLTAITLFVNVVLVFINLIHRIYYLAYPVVPRTKVHKDGGFDIQVSVIHELDADEDGDGTFVPATLIPTARDNETYFKVIIDPAHVVQFTSSLMANGTDVVGQGFDINEWVNKGMTLTMTEIAERLGLDPCDVRSCIENAEFINQVKMRNEIWTTVVKEIYIAGKTFSWLLTRMFLVETMILVTQTSNVQAGITNNLLETTVNPSWILAHNVMALIFYFIYYLFFFISTGLIATRGIMINPKAVTTVTVFQFVFLGAANFFKAGRDLSPDVLSWCFHWLFGLGILTTVVTAIALISKLKNARQFLRVTQKRIQRNVLGTGFLKAVSNIVENMSAIVVALAKVAHGNKKLTIMFVLSIICIVKSMSSTVETEKPKTGLSYVTYQHYFENPRTIQVRTFPVDLGLGTLIEKQNNLTKELTDYLAPCIPMVKENEVRYMKWDPLHATIGDFDTQYNVSNDMGREEVTILYSFSPNTKMPFIREFINPECDVTPIFIDKGEIANVTTLVMDLNPVLEIEGWYTYWDLFETLRTASLSYPARDVVSPPLIEVKDIDTQTRKKRKKRDTAQTIEGIVNNMNYLLQNKLFDNPGKQPTFEKLRKENFEPDELHKIETITTTPIPYDELFRTRPNAYRHRGSVMWKRRRKKSVRNHKDSGNPTLLDDFNEPDIESGKTFKQKKIAATTMTPLNKHEFLNTRFHRNRMLKRMNHHIEKRFFATTAIFATTAGYATNANCRACVKISDFNTYKSKQDAVNEANLAVDRSQTELIQLNREFTQAVYDGITNRLNKFEVNVNLRFSSLVTTNGLSRLVKVTAQNWKLNYEVKLKAWTYYVNLLNELIKADNIQNYDFQFMNLDNVILLVESENSRYAAKVGLIVKSDLRDLNTYSRKIMIVSKDGAEPQLYLEFGLKYRDKNQAKEVHIWQIEYTFGRIDVEACEYEVMTSKVWIMASLDYQTLFLGTGSLANTFCETVSCFAIDNINKHTTETERTELMALPLSTGWHNINYNYLPMQWYPSQICHSDIYGVNSVWKDSINSALHLNLRYAPKPTTVTITFHDFRNTITHTYRKTDIGMVTYSYNQTFDYTIEFDEWVVAGTMHYSGTILTANIIPELTTDIIEISGLQSFNVETGRFEFSDNSTFTSIEKNQEAFEVGLKILEKRTNESEILVADLKRFEITPDNDWGFEMGNFFSKLIEAPGEWLKIVADTIKHINDNPLGLGGLFNMEISSMVFHLISFGLHGFWLYQFYCKGKLGELELRSKRKKPKNYNSSSSNSDSDSDRKRKRKRKTKRPNSAYINRSFKPDNAEIMETNFTGKKDLPKKVNYEKALKDFVGLDTNV